MQHNVVISEQLDCKSKKANFVFLAAWPCLFVAKRQTLLGIVVNGLFVSSHFGRTWRGGVEGLYLPLFLGGDAKTRCF